MMLRCITLLLLTQYTLAFAPYVPLLPKSGVRTCGNSKGCTLQLQAEKSKSVELQDEAERFRSKAAALREEISASQAAATVSDQSSTTGSSNSNDASTTATTVTTSRWRISASETEDATTEYEEYRLYCDIGREEGTWMDPRWASSGKRMEFTVDVGFRKEQADEATQNAMVKDNVAGKSTPTYVVQCAKQARLLGGFDAMQCEKGGYRVDVSGGLSSTLRFFVVVDGKSGPEYGDVSCPEGRIYFSLPCFGSGVSQLSTKEGLMSVRQVGWNTGWRREESRMLGVFRAKKIDDAVKMDGY